MGYQPTDAEIVSAYSYAKTVAKRYWKSIPGYNVDDIAQHAIMVLIEESHRKEDNGIPFEHFAKRVIKTRIYNLMEDMTRIKRGSQAEHVEVNDEINKECRSEEAHHIVVREEESELVRQAIERLSEPYRAMLKLYVKGNDYRMIADILGRDWKSIRVMIHQGTMMLRNILVDMGVR